jgi:alpha-L-rhamnosidase
MRQISLALILSISILGCAADSQTAPAAPPDRQSLITDFGALPDGKTLCTAAIQKTIDELAAGGGGTVVVPAGVFLSGSIFLKPGVNLHLDQGAVIKGSTDISNYPQGKTRVEGHFQIWPAALVNADHADHLQISGEGTLDGSGQPFWTEFRTRIRQDKSTKNLDVLRPRLIFIQNSDDVRIDGIHLKNSGFWNLHLYRCTHAMVSGLDIQAPSGAPSTDGMDIDSSQNITISNCTIAVSDDCIALKGSKGPFALQDKDSPPVEHIHITGCTLMAGGGITCGSEATIVRDVRIDHCKVTGPRSRGIALLRLKLRPDTPQDYEDIVCTDNTGGGMGQIIIVAPWKQYFDLMGQKPPISTVRNVTISNVSGAFSAFGSIQPNPGDIVDGITFENIDVKTAGPAPRLAGVTHVAFNNVTINGKPYTPRATALVTTAPATP